MKFMRLRLKGTKETAIGIRASSGCVLVQFNRIDHPQAHGWWLYPRHHWVRRRNR